MTIDNLMANAWEYAKIAAGTIATVGTTVRLVYINQTQTAMEEAMYRSLEVVNPETLLKARKTLDSYLSDNSATFSTFGEILTTLALAGGVLAIASGIYNLAKNLKNERVE